MPHEVLKHFKVNVHSKNHYPNADLVINRKDFPDIQQNDIVEIYHPEDEFSRLLLQVTVFKDDLQGKDVVSVEQGVASTFQLRSFSDVVVRKVNFNSVVLDSLEVTFKDQYLGRSEMWRLRNSIINTCVYLNKKIEFCNGNARVQVCEMWCQGERVACGVINEETKLVFRSSTSMVYLFVQMSSEMWEFDVHGDLYFEKAINGFLADLFQKWKKYGSNHEVTIVLFSRVFYKASTIDEFPDYMRECLQQDYKNQFYEDFYRVAVQNEKYDDWNSSLVLLQSLFTEYRKTILEYHKKCESKMPFAYLSTAAHGNFLEVLNISLNVFDKHYLERSMDRTGQLSVVISPGVGVFEVDRELTNVTKQRIIDNGVGCDLVCIGEQPLHAVPLFKFHNKDKTILRNDYSMPHWINLSFYSGNKKLAFSKFIPRIRLPSRRITSRTTQSYQCSSSMNSKSKLPTSAVDETSLLGCSVSTADVDYDEYDDQVFSLPSSHMESVQKLFSRTRKLSYSQDTKAMKWKLSDPDIYRSTIGITRSTSITSAETNTTNELPRTSFIHSSGNRAKSQCRNEEDETHTGVGMVTGSVDSGPKNQFKNSHVQELEISALGPGRALINPFDPSHVTVKITSNRRRWTHIFPKGPSGYIIQQHHYQPEHQLEGELDRRSRRTSLYDSNSATEDDFHLAGFSPSSEYKLRSKGSTFVGSPNSSMYLPGRKTQTLLWGATGEQRWTPTLTTGVDWKSLVVPACLPITTDYFPDEVCLKTDYVFSDYNLLPDDVNADYARKRAIYRPPLSTQQVFFELISQRLAQGFQLIVENDTGSVATKNHFALVPKYVSKDATTECKLSIGRIFHRITLCGSEIRITRYRPRFPYPPFKIPYRYRFQAPDHITYGVSEASFEAEKLENFNWNFLDHYICTRGDTDFALTEACKYWRFRLYVLPSVQPGTKKILDGATHCDVYARSTYDEKLALLEGFLKFIESPVNKIRRTLMQKPSLKDSLTGQLIHRRHSTGIVLLSRSQVANSGSTSTAFRDRLGSINRERIMRPRSVSKMSEKQRASPVVDTVPSASPTPLNISAVDVENNDVFETGPENVKMTKESFTNVELVDMMSHPLNGVNFLSKSPSLPSCTFISYDAVQWLRKHVEGVLDETEAVQQFEELRKEKLICHASGDFSHPFLFGFFLYYIPHRGDKSPKDKIEFIEPINDVDTFKNEWAEVEMLPVVGKNGACAEFLLENLPLDWMDEDATSNKADALPYKEAYLEIDPNNRSDRIEWGHFRYQSVYHVEHAYELIIKWIAASGPIVSDLISSLARKSQTYNLQLIPVPADPHALPYAVKSDPLRGPVFVPLNISCLLAEGQNVLFEKFKRTTRLRRILLLLEEIAIRFGFIPCKGGSEDYNRHHQYVHLTGNIFLLITIPLNESEVDTVDRNDSSLRSSIRFGSRTSRGRMKHEYSHETGNESTISPHQKYIMKRLIEQEDKYKTDNRIGYLWSWNHMIGRRWKGSNAATNDEAFQDKLLLDFRKFCSNDEDRLRSFWDKCCLLGNDTDEF